MADIFIKDEGFAQVRIHNNPKAAKWAHEQGYKNSLERFGKEFAGEPVWYPGMENGVYYFGLTPEMVPPFIKAAEFAGLTVESEF